MLQKLLFIVFAFLAANGLFAQSGELKGKVLDKGTGEPIPFANVVVELNGNMIGGGITDFDGNYTVKPIPVGKYSVKASYVGYTAMLQEGVIINAEKITFLDLKLSTSSQTIGEIEVIEYVVPLISKDKTSSGETMTAEQIEKMPGRSANAVAITVAGVYSEGGEIGSIRGARAGGNVTYVDGVKIIGSSSLPQSAIAEVSVITGGLPAKFGDATGGIINITTKGPSNMFFGGVEAVTSKYLDGYDYNLFGASLSGPIWTRQNKDYPDRRDAILGYFLSGEMLYVKDGNPSSIPLYRAKDDIQQFITDEPLQMISTGQGVAVYQNASYLHEDAFETYSVKEGDDDFRFNIAGKLDFKPSKNVNFVLGGSIVRSKNNNWSFNSSMFNSDNFSESYYTNWRTYGRITQKFADNPDDNNQVIKNAYYSIQFDYEKTFGKTWDKEHKDNLFNYGYVGKLTSYRIPGYTRSLQTDSITGLEAHLLTGYFDTLVTYDYSDINYEMANYNENFFELFENDAFYRNHEIIQSFGGLLNGDGINSVYGLWASPGQLTAGYSNYENNQFRVSAAGSADINDHAITIGFEFEQRSFSSYSVGPSGLWTNARGLMNKHIEQLDFDNPILHFLVDEYGNTVYDDFGNPVFNDTISYPTLYSEADQALFDIKFRDYLGLDIDSRDFVDIDSYDPSDLNIDYFSADELLNSGNSFVSFRGYDVYGNKLNDNPTLQDFFTEIDSETGRLTRRLAPYEPTYAAAYIQDKFAFNDLVFNVGVRVDRYDANQMVLKDQYSLFETYKAGDNDPGNLLSEHPENIGENYVVYVDDVNNPSSIMGYRDGTTWFNAQGTEIDNPDVISTATGIQPYLVNPGVDMNSQDYLVSQSFEDYKPQITVMPRISFSFPISDVALFFAHYDVLSTRPSGIAINPIDYLFMNVRATQSRILTNPNLRPEKTFDYELGFQQKVGNTSAIKLSTFYREMRDMTQAINVVGAYPVYSYMTYGNIDFGTVKGFSMSYDLRRTGNISVRASYTLQFADGTGSSASEGLSLLNSGLPNLRTTQPLSFDQRHSFLANVDFRFAEGRAYNGPKTRSGYEILKNTGANLVIRSGSGSPYTKVEIVGGEMEGTLNGSRKPWRTTLDLTIDRDIMIVWGGEGENKKFSRLNIKLEVLNLLDTRNIINVYNSTGNPDDNGYLLASANQPSIEAQVDELAFRNYYAMAINVPWNYSRPRTVRLGITLDF